MRHWDMVDAVSRIMFEGRGATFAHDLKAIESELAGVHKKLDALSDKISANRDVAIDVDHKAMLDGLKQVQGAMNALKDYREQLEGLE